MSSTRRAGCELSASITAAANRLRRADVERLGDGCRDQPGLRVGRQVDEEGVARQLERELRRGGEGETGLAGAARPGQRDQPDVVTPKERCDRGGLEPPADERRRRHRQPCLRRRRPDRGRERRLLAQDCPLELPQGRAGLDAELVREHSPRLPVGVERLLLSAVAIERDDLLFAEALPERMLCDEPGQLVEQPPVAAERELGVVSELERAQPAVVELGRPCPDRLLGEIRERRPAPQREGRPQLLRRLGGVTRLERRASALERPLEALEVELVRLEHDPIAVPVRLDPAAAERLPQPVDVDLKRRERRPGRSLAPDGVHEPLPRDDRAAREQQLRQHGTLLWRAQR